MHRNPNQAAFLLSSPAPEISMTKTGNRSTSAAEDYLERIQELIDTKGYARVVDIAGSLSISQASVTNMVKRLDVEGFVRHEKYRGLILTTEGEAIARAIARRHRILTDFLKIMGVPENDVEHDVEGMEHHLSAASLTAIEGLLKELSENGTFLSKVRDAVGRIAAS
jgi:Mn-dependent DtxR family transcriptional regulator